MISPYYLAKLIEAGNDKAQPAAASVTTLAPATDSAKDVSNAA